jgi:ABC-type bacteriocin/lantibiotic exporter with double-glycine peptidase domain
MNVLIANFLGLVALVLLGVVLGAVLLDFNGRWVWVVLGASIVFGLTSLYLDRRRR